MSLTEEQRAAIDRSWGVIKQNLKQSGVDLFIIIFKAKPAYQDYFPQFKGLSLEEVEHSTKMRAHGSIFMNAMNSMVENLDDLEVAAEIMRRKVQSHYPRGMRKEHYEAVFDVVWPAFLKQKLDGGYDEVTAAAWVVVCSILMSVTLAELEKLEKAE